MELEKLDAWRPLLSEELKKPYFAALAERVDAAYGTQAVFPPREELFTAFELTPPEAVTCRPSIFASSRYKSRLVPFSAPSRLMSV